MRRRLDIETDDAGNEFYTPRATDHIHEHAQRLGITFSQAAELYELGRLERAEPEDFGEDE